MNEKFFTDIRAIKEAIDSKKLVVFAGAGISIDAGVPAWKLLIDEMKNDMSVPNGEDDFLRIAQMYYNERQEKEFIDKVRKVLRHKKLRYNEIHEAVFELNPEHILTTNFDDLLEQVIRSKAYPFTVIKKDSDLPYSQSSNLLIKIHGDLEEGNLVLKEDDYLEFESKHPLIESFIKNMFSSKVVLFVGYSFSDINLKVILQSVRNILGQDFQNAYLLSIDEKFHPNKREYLKKKGINVLCYSDFNFPKDGNYIEKYLKSNNALNAFYYIKGKTLKEEGQKLFNFLKFINKYDVFSESVFKKNIIDQMYLSLKRFNEVKSLPNTFIGNIFPFNRSNDYIHSYDNYSLRSNNDQITNFF